MNAKMDEEVGGPSESAGGSSRLSGYAVSVESRKWKKILVKDFVLCCIL